MGENEEKLTRLKRDIVNIPRSYLSKFEIDLTKLASEEYPNQSINSEIRTINTIENARDIIYDNIFIKECYRYLGNYIDITNRSDATQG